MQPARSPSSFFIRPNGRSPASLDTLSEGSSHSPFTHSPAQDLPPLPTSDTATDSHTSSRTRHSPQSNSQYPLPAGTYRGEQVDPTSKDQDSSRIMERTHEVEPHDFIPVIASPRTPAMGDTIPRVSAGGSSSQNSLLLDTSTTQGGVTFVTDTASTLVSDMLSMTLPHSADVDSVVADAAQTLAAACLPLFQQALQKIYDHARTESRS
jgi:hypothetical protein